MNVLLNKFKEVSIAVAPVVIFVTILNFTLAPLPGVSFLQFLLGALAITAGLSVLLFGVDIGILPLGSNMGMTFLKSNKLLFIVAVGLALGFFINFAEPDVAVLASQVSSVSGGLISPIAIRTAVAAGAGMLLTLGIIRIVKGFSLPVLMLIIYGLAAVMSVFASPDMMAIAFDASGAATGAVTVPLVLALSVGLAAMRRDSRSAEEDSFGLVGVMASGAVIGVLALNLFFRTDGVTGVLEMDHIDTDSLFGPFIADIPVVALETALALLPILVMLVVFQRFKFHLPRKSFRRMFLGFVYVYIGLVLFFVGVHAGFMNVGNIIGHSLAMLDNRFLLVGLAFVLGLLVILTEPAVYVLTHQIEDVTNGYIKRKTVLLFLAIGVASAVGLSMLRIVVDGLMFWHYLLPGFLIVFILVFFFTPKMFAGIAFDSGAVASGPMTVTFVLAFAQGASEALEHSNVLADSFGVIALVTLMPVIALQILGLIYKHKTKRREVRKPNGEV
ncbi:MAG: DUF1538 domain-containing protein [Oscillospiraceae bacterium]|nr:DUF1538 domain-containing protein [Oscillospiraceae bacterium]